MQNYTQHLNVSGATVSEPIFGKQQVRNSDGGYVWAIDDWKRLDRFLILGTEGGTYYTNERKLTVDNAKAVLRTIAQDGQRVVRRLVEISEAGRAPKNDAALFVLALAVSRGDLETRKAALRALPRVARIGTHLFTFLEYAQSFRGWGGGLKRAIGRWYSDRDADALAYQMVKYRQRGGWSHFDAVKLSHPTAPTAAHHALFHWVTREKVLGVLPANLPSLVEAFVELQQMKEASTVAKHLQSNKGLTWEMVPTEFLGQAQVWEALLPNLLPTALIRNLGRMTANGLIAPLSDAAKVVVAKLTDADAIRKAKVHPIAVLGALSTYRQGKGAKGDLTWNPNGRVLDALDEAFYTTFGNIKPSGNRFLLGVDVSTSMTWEKHQIAGMPGLTPRVASAAMAMVTAKTEADYHVMGFSHQLRSLDISPRQRLDDVLRKMEEMPYGATNCALPMEWALANRVPVDTFVVYTDNEVNEGQHPSSALLKYRQAMGIPAKLVVVGMSATEFSIADPDDAGMMDVVGFDTAAPQLISDFAGE